MVIAIIMVAAVLRFASQVFIPFAVSIIFLFVFSPMVVFITSKLRLPRSIAILGVLVVFMFISAVIGVAVFSSIRSLVGQFPVYAERLEMLFNTLIAQYELPAGVQEYVFSASGFQGVIRTWLLTISSNSISFISGLLLVVIFLLFLLLEQGSFSHKLARALSLAQVSKVTTIIKEIYSSTTKYVNTKILVSLATGVLISIAFSIIGVDFPLVWGMLSFLFNFIPSIGSILVVVLSVLFSMAQFAPTWGPVIAVGVTSLIIQFTIGNLIEPRIIGRSLNLSTVVIILSLLIWSAIWGVSGLFLAVPMMVIVKILLQSLPATKPIAILMEGGGRYDKQASSSPESSPAPAPAAPASKSKTTAPAKSTTASAPRARKPRAGK